MTAKLIRRVCVVLAAALMVVGGSASLVAAEPAELPDLIARLGDNLFANREAASKQIEKLGEPALPALRRAAAKAEDIEIRGRAQQLVRIILLRACQSKATEMEFEIIDPGEFTMGSPEREGGRRIDEKEHKVRVTTLYLIGCYEVTQKEYERVAKSNPSWFTRDADGKDSVAGEDTSRFPVERVSWYDAVLFCNKLSELDGYEAYYKPEDIEREKDAIKSASVTLQNNNGYRLPTEAEWEFACRAGTKTWFHFGNANTGREANLKPGGSTFYASPPSWKALGRTAKVGSYPANREGLFDMHGNVGEWCWDWYDGDYYANSPEADPRGPASGKQRVVRGGSWMVNESSCRSASRFWQLPNEGNYYTGFRVARTP
jgi:formylglycine-generating enzyme required for sulfatase activity